MSKHNSSFDVGTWVPGVPSKLNFRDGMLNEISVTNSHYQKLRIVTVLQAPFIMINNITSKQINY